MVDYYQVLGVIPSAEAVVIKAAYRALANIYHPDRNNDPTAQEKIKALNEAYSTLSNPTKREVYDKNRIIEEHSANLSAFDRTQPFTTDPLANSWQIAISFYPAIQGAFENLGNISWRLAFAFKLYLIESQKYLTAITIAQKMKEEYLAGYFGTNKEIVDYAEQLIVHGEISAALHLNSIVKVMGNSVSIWQVKRIIQKEFPEIDIRLTNKQLYRKLTDEPPYLRITAADRLAALNGATVKRRMWGSKVLLKIDGQQLTFDNNEKYCQFLSAYFAPKYAP